MSIAALRTTVLVGIVALAAGLPQAGSGSADAHGAAVPAKALFGAVAKPDKDPARSIGFYARGCLAGAVPLPITGTHWQVMRLSRNRNWGHPDLVKTIEHLADHLHASGGWDGILVGDMSQPRGGPMLTGHASHQVGLDVDIWLTPWPDHVLSREERETMSAVNMIAADGNDVDRKVWTPQQVALIRAAAKEPLVERIFVNPAIKKALCHDVHGDRSWLHKVRPYWHHRTHMHVRIRCPAGQSGCRNQPPVPPGDGCGKELAWWFTKAVRAPVKKPVKPRPPLTLADLPGACRRVLDAP